ncbi:MAG: alpha/beta hydrolase [Deltaproteobacteria bacterium]|nr:alpha/beta hydrolase [Deltaproteobacteria bacterium]MBW2256535.1 alpha/beta hydrolase [Deltaproteobacteria bacterium]
MNRPTLDKKYLRTSFGDIAYLETGSPDAPPVLFIHGIPTSSYLWRHVLRFLQEDFHCLAPDLMGLGDTEVDPDVVPLHMDNQAEMLVEFMSKLGHDTFAMVCHDQGGAAAQIIAARMPQRVRAFVITDCVCYDNWPVPAIMRAQKLSKIPVLSNLAARLGLFEWMQTSILSDFKRGVYDRSRLSDESIREYLRPLRSGRRARKRMIAFLLAGHPRYSELAVDGLREFDKPTMILWAADDRFLTPSWGLKLREDIPGAVVFELIPFCGHFWQEERPAEFVSHMSAFLKQHLFPAAERAKSEEASRAPATDPVDQSELPLPHAPSQ